MTLTGDSLFQQEIIILTFLAIILAVKFTKSLTEKPRKCPQMPPAAVCATSEPFPLLHVVGGLLPGVAAAEVVAGEGDVVLAPHLLAAAGGGRLLVGPPDGGAPLFVGAEHAVEVHRPSLPLALQVLKGKRGRCRSQSWAVFFFILRDASTETELEKGQFWFI